VSVKTRIAALDTPEDMEGDVGDDGRGGVRPDLDEGRYETLCRYLDKIRDGGADHVILHARPAVLSGLSPSKNRIVPRLNYGFVEQAAKDFPDLRVTLNGGIASLSDLESILANGGVVGVEDGEPHRGNMFLPGRVASHMAGRWMLRRPLDLAAVQSRYLSPVDSNPRSRAAGEEGRFAMRAVRSYLEYMEKEISGKGARTAACPTTAELLLPVYLVVEQLREDYDLLLHDEIDANSEATVEASMSVNDMESVYEMVVDAFEWLEDITGGRKRKKSKIPSHDTFNFKKLAAAFKGLVGTKVANKWKRNRAEL